MAMGIYGQLKELLRQGNLYMATVLNEGGGKAVWNCRGELLGRQGMDEDLCRAVMVAVPGKESGAPGKESGASGLPGRLEIGGSPLFVERLAGATELVICGGGHISLELAALADYMEYGYTVLDDREEFCSRERFPRAKACLCGPMAERLRAGDFPAEAYYIIVTRGHAADLECLEEVLKLPYGYVGMIGSRAKVARVMETLTQHGVSREKLEDVHAPIGLPIGGQTPKEIAVSILAQLVQQKNREPSFDCLDRELLQALEEDRPGILATVIRKEGSAPRGPGSRMLVREDGRGLAAVGTVGGGLMEAEVVREAGMFLADIRDRRHGGADRLRIRTYQVNTQAAGALGMWCGGSMEVMLEQISSEKEKP